MSGGNLSEENAGAVTLSVVSHGHDRELRALLSQLAELSARHVSRVVLTLNRPEPELRAFATGRAWPFELRLRENAMPLGFGDNHNRAFAECRSAAFCVANPDIRLVTDPFGDLLKALGHSTAVGCAYPRQQTSGGQTQDSQRTLPTPARVFLRRLLPSMRRPAADGAVDWVNGAFMLFDAQAFAAVSGFDARYFMYGEDVDICLRLQLAGYTLARGEVVVGHDAHRASHARLRHLAWHVRSLLRLWGSDTYRKFRAWRRAQRA